MFLILFLFSCGWLVEPDAVSSSQARVIANWNFIPYQHISSTVNVGVVAFHESGVDVEFEINGIKTRKTKPEMNPQTSPDNLNTILSNDTTFKGVYEYFITVNPANYPDGPVTIKATAYPDDDSYLPKELPDMIIYANTDGTLNNNTVKYADSVNGDDDLNNGNTLISAYKTLEKAFVSVGAGGTVLLAKSSIPYTCQNRGLSGGNYSRWTIISSVTGNPADVIIIPDTTNLSSVFLQNFIKWDNVTIRKSSSDYAYYTPTDYHTWFNKCIIESGTYPDSSGTLINHQNSKYYISDSYIKDFQNPVGWWMRNCVIENTGGDVWRANNDSFFINIEIRAMNPNPGAHPDLIQFENPGRTVDNIILYNVKALAMNSQGIFGGGGSNVAFVNLLMDKNVNDSKLSQPGSFHHLLFWHCTINNIKVVLHSSDNRYYWHVQNNIFYTLYDELTPCKTSLPMSYIANNLYIRRNFNQFNGGYGTDYIGCVDIETSPGFVDSTNSDALNRDFHISSDGLAHHVGEVQECVPADINGDLFSTTNPTIGSFISTNE